MKAKTLRTAIWAICAILSFTASASVYDPAADFSLDSNPNGPWSYGSKGAVTGALTLFTEHSSGSQTEGWRGSSTWPDSYPAIQHNWSGVVFDDGGGWVVPPGGMDLAAGPYGKYADLRFTAPLSGTYDIVGVFTSNMHSYGGFAGATVDVHVQVNDGTPFLDGLILRYGDAVPFSQRLTLGKGDTVDFLVGPGGNGFLADSAGLQTVITAVPESATAWTGALAAAGMVAGLLPRKTPRQ